MPVSSLDAAVTARLRAEPFTYTEVGRTAAELPADYVPTTGSRTLASKDFGAAADALLTWQVQERVGIRVAASSPRVEPDAVAVLRLGFGPVGIDAPCRVAYVVDEPNRQGFAYGTLAGHPESGEEAFVLTLGPDGAITFTITAFSAAASTLARLGGPVTRAVQRAALRRYLRALDR